MSRWDITEEYVMKKILVLMSLIVVVFLSACKPEPEPTPEPEPEELDGVYNPEKRISRIYKDDGNGKKLREVWRWNNDVLQSIDHYDSFGDLSYTEEFSYNDNGQVERVDNFRGNTYTEYKYDGNKLSRATNYEVGSMIEEYSFTYKDDKISEIEMMYFGEKINCCCLMKDRHNPIKMIFAENDCQAIQEIMTNLDLRDVNALVKLIWKDNNISKIDFTKGSYRNIAECKYDDKSNPFKNYYDLYGASDCNIGAGYGDDGYSTYSTNNITEIRCTETGEEEKTSIHKYSYSYDDKFPTVQRYVYSYTIGGYYEEYWNGYEYEEFWVEEETITRTTSTYYEYE